MSPPVGYFALILAIIALGFACYVLGHKDGFRAGEHSMQEQLFGHAAKEGP